MTITPRKDGKFLVVRVINGMAFRNIMTAAQVEIEQAKPKYADEPRRRIPFGQPGYTG